jgi:hypothetical protein
MIYLPMAAALAIGLTSATPTVAGDNAAAPEDNPMLHMRDNYYGGSVYVAPTYRPYAYGYRTYDPYYYNGPRIGFSLHLGSDRFYDRHRHRYWRYHG